MWWPCSPAPSSTPRSPVRCYPSMFQGADDFMAPMFPLADARRPLRRRPDRADRRREPLPRRRRRRAHRDRLRPARRRSSTAISRSPTPTNLVHPNRAEQHRHADGGAARARRRRRCRRRRAPGHRDASCSTATARCRWSAAASSPAGSRSTSGSTCGIASQNPHEARLSVLRRVTGVPENQIRVQIGDVGGGFGLKSFVGREEMVDRRSPPTCSTRR